MGNVHPNVPANSPGAALVTAGVNMAWARTGSGSPDFWGTFGDVVYRDSAAKMAPLSPLQYKDGYYLMVVNTAMDYAVKARLESRDLSDDTSTVMVGPVNAPRVDAKPQPLELEPGEDPTGLIRQTIEDRYQSWGAHMPLFQLARLLTNGTPIEGMPAPVCYDGQPLISAAHKIDPNKSGASNEYSNLVTLGAAVNEAGWLDILTRLRRFPDCDGKTLPNATATKKPLIVCPSEAVAARWVHFLGGPNVPKDLLMQGSSAGIHSVSVGRADVVVCDFLATLANSGLSFNPEKRSYIIARGGVRKPVIYREKVTPRVQTTGAGGYAAYKHQAEILYAYAYTTSHPAEYRSIVAADEP